MTVPAFSLRLALPAAALSLIAAPAAAELPDPVRAMIEAAMETGDKDKVAAVVEAARATNPDDLAEIDAMKVEFDRRQAELAAAEAAAEREAIRQASLIENWSGQGQIGAFQSSGNTDSIGVTAALALEREGIDWTHKFNGAVDYRRTDGRTSREQFQAAYEPRYQMNERLFAYGLAQFERDRRQGFSARYSFSGGIGYKVIDNERMDLSIKGGPAYRITRLTTGETSDRLAGLLGLDFDWLLAEDLKLTQDVNAVADAGGSAQLIVDSSNTTLNLVTGLEAGILDDLTARLSYTVEYDSNPPAGAVSTDTLTRFTLVYGF
jgi:putative salt-induced outer membrane protein